ncbi:transporter associated domain-containing protein [Nereida sp. MMG025]|uniref:transporter associated domain-containing protein n=1 Tax=Nereida sp. MMG025 TaxID=2909981 RepID=UPI001F4068B3|nr:transporter associated domain-containing protein [Nereida sp. MMG025]MCF6445615.1 CBS domain-containing protein [Nereida sp. MMG025]
MTDSPDGSSSAAQGAQNQPQTTEPTPDTERAIAKSDGFFSRIIGALSPSDVEDTPAQPTEMARPTHGMVNLRRLQLDDIAIPKIEITAVPVDISKDDLVEVFRESGLTRLPVFEGTLDTPIGLVHLKDLALRHGFNGNGDFDLRGMLRELIYAPPSMPTGVLLQRMQAERIHMALVIDEYGGVDGLVTIEDLIEQVIGEIEDEHDIEEDQLWTREKEGCYLALAKTPLDEFEEAIGQSLTDDDEIDEEDIDTLGGLVFMLSGSVPARGEVVKHPSGAEFEVVDADPRRIKRLRVRVP